MSKNKSSKRSNGSQCKPRRRNRGSLNPNSNLIMSPLRNLAFSPSNPGRVSIRSAFEVFNTNGSAAISFNGFSTWSSSLRSILTPFEYFRVNNLSCQARIAGGTASSFSIIYNVTNAPTVDSSSVAILNDDYAAVATASIQPTLQPPKPYWTQGARKWYNALDPATGLSTTDLIAGTISYRGSGGSTAADTVGWLIVDVDIEFHTLV